MHYSIEPQVLKFKQPAGTSRGVYLERRLWYVHLYEGPYHGIGECAPLFDLSCDYKEDMYSLIDEACQSLVANGEIDYQRYADCPSVLFALETALLSLEGSRSGNALRLYDNSFTRCEMGIPINGLVWMGTYDQMLQRMEEKLALGFGCIKIKIGAIDFDKEVALLRHLRERFPIDKVQLRVDANGGFSPQEAPEKLRTLASLDIHSIEQPIRQHQWPQMAALCKQTPIPIALDEELIGVNKLEDKRRLLDTILPQYIILKPTLHGGIKGCEEWIAEARKRNIGYWITSALESNVGLNAIAQWAAQIGCTHMPQGLGTGQLFETNYEATDLEINGDRLWYCSQRQREFIKETENFKSEWHNSSPQMQVHTSGSTGTPKPMLVDKEKMANSARATLRFLRLQPGDSALLCLPLQYIAGKMVVVRSIVGKLRLIATAPSSRPFRTLTTSPTFAAITPMQAAETLLHSHDTKVMRGVQQLIIGGGAIPAPLEKTLRHFPNNVWSTYGMTETLSHIAMRRLNTAEASKSYTPFPGVGIALDADNSLIITAPEVCDQPLATNDIARINPDGTFEIIGRKDNVVCSGGIKLQLEEIEQKIKTVVSFPFMLTSVPDNKLGEALVMLYHGQQTAADILQTIAPALSPYEQPRHILPTNKLPYTQTNKPARNQAKALAKQLLSQT